HDGVFGETVAEAKDGGLRRQHAGEQWKRFGRVAEHKKIVVLPFTLSADKELAQPQFAPIGCEDTERVGTFAVTEERRRIWSDGGADKQGVEAEPLEPVAQVVLEQLERHQ